MVEGLDSDHKDWPVVFILKDGTRISTRADEIFDRDLDGIFDVECDNTIFGSTAYFELNDVICILT